MAISALAKDSLGISSTKQEVKRFAPNYTLNQGIEAKPSNLSSTANGNLGISSPKQGVKHSSKQGAEVISSNPSFTTKDNLGISSPKQGVNFNLLQQHSSFRPDSDSPAYMARHGISNVHLGSSNDDSELPYKFRRPKNHNPVRPHGIDSRAIYMGLYEDDSDIRNWHIRPTLWKNMTAVEKAARTYRDHRRKLPIWNRGTDIRLALREKDVMVLIGETGSGKSTQMPQYLCIEPWCKKQQFKVDDRTVHVGGIIAVTQPRRVAVLKLARRVSAEMGYQQDDREGTVGYAVRWNKFIPKNMKIKFLTEGVLLRELATDPHLKKYSAVIVDEIHERTLEVDLLTGFLKNIVTGDKKGRHGVPLKIVVMSATLEVDKVIDFFEGKQESETKPEIRNQQDIEPPNESRRSSKSTNPTESTWDGFSSSNETSENDDKEGNSKAVVDVAITNRRNSDSSATLDGTNAETLIKTKLPQNLSVVFVEGRQYPVRVLYLPGRVDDYLDATLRAINKIHTTRPYPGDILVFLTGEGEIKAVQKMVEKMATTFNGKEVPFLQVMPLYSKLPDTEQDKALEPLRAKRIRKVILATNVAEASLTVPGVRYVVDCGKSKIKEFRTGLGLDSLLVKPISKSSAQQRKGRAGREMAGECYRLYTSKDYDDLPESTVPGILRSDVLQAVLLMKSRGIEDPTTFPLMDPPEKRAIINAIFQLFTLGALDKDNKITKVGSLMSEFPIPPAYARVLIAAAEEGHDCLLEAIDAIACLTADGDIFTQPTSEQQREETQSARDSLNRREGDILTLLTTIRRYLTQPATPKERRIWCEQHQVNFSIMHQATLVRKQLQEDCVKQKLMSAISDGLDAFEPIKEEKGQSLLKCFLRAFAEKTAILLPDKSYRTIVSRNSVTIHPSSVLHGKKCEAILFLEQVYTSKHFAKKVNVVQMDWVTSALLAQRN